MADKQNSNATYIWLFVGAVAILVIFGWQLSESWVSEKPENTELIIHETDPQRGNPSAPLTIIEFGDFQCPFCAEQVEVLKQFVDEDGNCRPF